MLFQNDSIIVNEISTFQNKIRKKDYRHECKKTTTRKPMRKKRKTLFLSWLNTNRIIECASITEPVFTDECMWMCYFTIWPKWKTNKTDS